MTICFHHVGESNRLEALLALEGRRLSAITIQKILNDKGLGIRHERWLALERSHAGQVIELSPEQAAFLEKLNPCFKERRVESERPGPRPMVDSRSPGKSAGRSVASMLVPARGQILGSKAAGQRVELARAPGAHRYMPRDVRDRCETAEPLPLSERGVVEADPE